MDSAIYNKNTLEFVTVAVQFCAFLEEPAMDRIAFTDTCSKILPLLYLKGALLPECKEESDCYVEQFVTEADYTNLRNQLMELFGEDDAYLEVFHPDMPYSDAPVAASISEDLADIYQDIKNFAALYRQENEENMMQALVECKKNFADEWGRKLLNVMRPLHALRNHETNDDFSDDENGYNTFYE